jgi:hypothetical protein
MVTFLYKNQQLLKLLKQRGDALKYHDKVELRRLNKLLTAKVSKRFLPMQVPLMAYVTFYHSQAVSVSIKNKNKVFAFGQTLLAQEAENPSDIIWEHFASFRMKVFLRKVLLFLTIFAFFIATVLLKL